MEEHYDVICLGTGLTECILSGLFSTDGKRVLHMDRNDHYGGASASLNLTQLYKRYRDGATPPAAFGRDRDFCIDLVPKLMMAEGSFVRMLTSTRVTEYLEFRQIAGSYVYRSGKIYKVPTSENEALFSSLLGMLDKNRARRFFKWIAELPAAGAQPAVPDVDRCTMAEVYKHFSLDRNVQDFVGHALALHLNDDYVTAPRARDTIDRIVLYQKSMMRFGVTPYVYPAYGLGELPQAFARLSAVYGGTYMLGRPVDAVLYDESGRVTGVESGGEKAYAPLVIADPSYFPAKTRSTGKIVRSISILNHPIANTDGAHSVQLILPQSQVNRKHDIFVVCLSSSHSVCAKDFYVAIASTTVCTENPAAELEAAHNLLKPIAEQFIEVVDVFEPVADGKADGVIISKSYDATSHFETVSADVFDMYKRATGNDLVLKDPPRDANAGC